MVQNVTPTFLKTPNNSKVQILPADTTAQKTVYTAGSNGSKVIAVMATSTDGTLAHDIQLSITNGGTSYLLGTTSVPINAGTTSAIPAINIMTVSNMPGLALDSDGNEYVFLISGDTLTVSAVVTVTTAKAVTCIAMGADF